MKKEKVIWSVFMSENGLSYSIGNSMEIENQTTGFVPFEDGWMEKGYIKNPIQIQQKLNETKKEKHISAKKVRIVLGEENIIFKNIKIDKVKLDSAKLKDYLYNQIGVSIHVPFDQPIIDYYIFNENETTIEAVLFISDENLVYDYVDLFESMKIYDIEFDNAFLANYRLFYYYQKNSEIIGEDNEPNLTGLMNVSIYHNKLTISIFDKMIPVFTLIEILEEESFCEMAASYIERIANYYQYNLHKGKMKINHIEVFDYRDCRAETHIAQGLNKQITDFKINYFDLSQIEIYRDEICHKGFFMAFSANLKEEDVLR